MITSSPSHPHSLPDHASMEAAIFAFLFEPASPCNSLPALARQLNISIADFLRALASHPDAAHIIAVATHHRLAAARLHALAVIDTVAVDPQSPPAEQRRAARTILSHKSPFESTNTQTRAAPAPRRPKRPAEPSFSDPDSPEVNALLDSIFSSLAAAKSNTSPDHPSSPLPDPHPSEHAAPTDESVDPQPPPAPASHISPVAPAPPTTTTSRAATTPPRAESPSRPRAPT